MKFKYSGNNIVEAEAIDERGDIIREVTLEKLPKDGEGENDLVDMAKAVDEDGESDVAGVASDSI